MKGAISMAFDLINTSGVADVTRVHTANERMLHLAGLSTGGGIFPETLCGQKVAHGTFDEETDDADLCATCTRSVEKVAESENGVPPSMVSVAGILRSAGRAEKSRAKAEDSEKAGDTANRASGRKNEAGEAKSGPAGATEPTAATV